MHMADDFETNEQERDESPQQQENEKKKIGAGTVILFIIAFSIPAFFLLTSPWPFGSNEQIVQTPLPTPSPQPQAINNQPSEKTGIPEGYFAEVIHIKFVGGSEDVPMEELLSAHMKNSLEYMRRLITLSDEELQKIGGERLRLWFEIKLLPGIDAVQFMGELRGLSNVESAEFAPLPAPPPEL